MDANEITIQEYFNERVTHWYGAQAKQVYRVTISELCPDGFVHSCPTLIKITDDYYKVEFLDYKGTERAYAYFDGNNKLSAIIGYLKRV